MPNIDQTTLTSADENPHFKNIDRAPYELGYLLRKLPSDFSTASQLTEETKQIAAAAAQHASNANCTLMRGMEAIGNLMVVAGMNSESSVDGRTVMNLGELIEHIAADAQFLQETDAYLSFVLKAKAGRRDDTQKRRRLDDAPN